MPRKKYPDLPILLVDDEEQFLLSVRFALNAAGITNVAECNDSLTVRQRLDSECFGVVLLDLNMPGISGLELLPLLAGEHPEVVITVMTAINDVDTAVGCMRTGAFDYLVKPVDNDRLITHIRRAIAHAEMQQENTRLKEHLLSGDLKHPEAFAPIVTRSKKMLSIFQYIESIAATSLPVLVTGETGTGKELIAESLHRVSGRHGKFVSLNVAGIDDSLFSDTLFGHDRGAYTGAEGERKGLIEEAAGGTLFLDEIGDLRIESQVKLLRLLQEHTYYRLGSDNARTTDAHVVVATNCDLKAQADQGTFRKDLYYRLYAHHVRIPPLKERKDDLPLLAEFFLERAAGDMGRKKPTVPKELYPLLNTHPFPGNVRELEAMVYDAVSRHQSGVLSLASFKEKVLPGGTNGENIPARTESLQFPEELPTLRDVEAMLIDEAMQRAGDNQTIAARLLGISRNTLTSRLNRT